MRDCAAMLVRFSVENYLCFGPRTVLDLCQPSIGGGSGGAPARIALVHGAPASGKSALLRAFGLLRTLTLAGPRPPLPLLPNRFYGDRPSRFELEVQLQAARFHYVLSLTPSQILDESLHITSRPEGSSGEPTTRLVFERKSAAPGRPPVIELGDVAGQDAGRLRLVAQSTRPEQPILHEGLRRGLPLFVPLGVWLRDRLQLLLPEAKLVGLAARGARDPGFLDFLSDYLAVARLGIRRLGVERQPLPAGYFQSPEEQEEVTAELTRFADSFAETPEGELIAQPASDGPFVDIERVRLTQTVLGPDGAEAELSAEELPQTARRLLHLSPLFYAAATAPTPPPCAIIDDLGHSLTPSLLRSLLSRFACDADLPEERQLIGFLPSAEGGGPDLARQLIVDLRAEAGAVATQLWALGRSSAGSQLTVVV